MGTVSKVKTATGKTQSPARALDLSSTFDILKRVLAPYEMQCVVKTDKPKDYHLYTRKKILKGQQIYFAGVKSNKNYVSFYLMTVYGSPEQKKSISPQLKKRMQGKACFNFTSVEPALLKDLSALVKAGSKKFLETDELDVTGMKCD
jgi:hypothetical protein